MYNTEKDSLCFTADCISAYLGSWAQETSEIRPDRVFLINIGALEDVTIERSCCCRWRSSDLEKSKKNQWTSVASVLLSVWESSAFTQALCLLQAWCWNTKSFPNDRTWSLYKDLDSLLILVPPVAISNKSTTASCAEELDLSVRAFVLKVSERKRQHIFKKRLIFCLQDAWQYRNVYICDCVVSITLPWE